ncbi:MULTISPECIES: aldo/keto reductase [Streptomyces]|uniref:Glucose-fructose oxidoreductase n=1 Tax=Streptomyces chartreusis NRRL 3882 TaxID=1079985 RepID=A0A2N9B3B1_STRCX|nr:MULTISPECIES: aldo/keto reductase [Streptomyces]MYS89709.1 Gfo/Idh/MocA family oxidoreductase [Streptomyces sp. SID5464]SOR77834.1 Glucose-fructose oxidoreductase precursor [Streptomyces chartreusis NRRL 3882]
MPTIKNEKDSAALRLAILGSGNMARRFLKQLPDSRRCELRAIGDRDPEQARLLCDEVGDLFAGDPIWGTEDDVLSSAQVDAVYIATVHTTHARLAMRAVAAGKHVLCEKPLTVNHAQAMAVVDAAQHTGVRVVEAMMFRFHPQMAAARELVRTGEIGEVRHIDAGFAFFVPTDPKAPTIVTADLVIPDAGGLTGRLFDPQLAGGGILDVGCYPMSIARAIAGAAAGVDFLEPVSLTADGSVGEAGVDEWAIARMRFGNGVTASLRTGVRMVDNNTVQIVGSKGTIEMLDPWALSTSPQVIIRRVGHLPEQRTFPASGAYALQMDAFAESVRGPEPEQLSNEDSLGNTAALDRWRAAIGVRYPFERDDATITTVSAYPLSVPAPVGGADHRGPGRIEGLDKPLSRIVMGCDHQPDLSTASALFDHYVTLGGNVFDTAHFYLDGQAERRLGKWIADRGIRDDVVVIGKGAHTPDCNPEALSRQLLESLDRQGTGHLDVYLLHRDNEDIPAGEFVDVLNEHADAGLVRVFGGSNWSIQRVEEANAWARANGKRGFSVLSNYFGLAEPHDLPWPGCLDACDAESMRWLTERQMPLLAWSARSRNFFVRADPSDLTDELLVRCFYGCENFERKRRAEKLARDHGVSPSAIAVAYVLHQPFPTFAMYGPKTLAESRASFRAVEIDLSAEQVAWLRGES